MSEEYNPEGPELDDVFEAPVKCHGCGDYHEFEDSNHFVSRLCGCKEVSSCTHYYDSKCVERLK